MKAYVNVHLIIALILIIEVLYSMDKEGVTHVNDNAEHEHVMINTVGNIVR